MKKILLAFGCLAAVVFQSCTGCKEIGPSVNLTPVSKGNYDSVYTLTGTEIASLSPDPHNVLVEEFTGQNCNNCPAAHSIIDNNVTANPGRVNAIGLYPYGPPQAIPPTGAVYDFRDSICTNIGSVIYGGILGLPSGGVDRTPIAGSISLFSNSWSDAITTQKGLVDSVNMTLKSSFDTATKTATIVVKVTYLQSVSTKQNLTVVLTEDDMVDLQEFPGGVHEGYVFTDVFRDMISLSPSGSPILDSFATKTKGMTLQRTFAYKLRTKTPAIVPANCHVVAFVNSVNGTDQRVWQSVKTKLK
jgi:Outer membrane protein Omp28